MHQNDIDEWERILRDEVAKLPKEEKRREEKTTEQTRRHVERRGEERKGEENKREGKLWRYILSLAGDPPDWGGKVSEFGSR